MKTMQYYLCALIMLTYVHCRSTGSQGKALIKHFESLRLNAYQDSADIWTIGWGHTKGVKRGDIWTQDKADAIFVNDLKEFERYVNWYVKVPLNQNQFDALVSWTFNLGPRNLESSTMLKKLNSWKFNEVPTQMKRWVHSGGRKLSGLVKRRNAEARLFQGLNWRGYSISNNGISLIKHFTGCQLTAYHDGVRTWVIGWGHTQGVNESHQWTQAKADDVFKKDLIEFQTYVNSHVEVPLNQNQFDALVSWTFHLGPGNLKSSTMLKRLNSGNYGEVPAQMRRWVYAGGKKLPVLIKRRNAEARLFQGLDWREKSISKEGMDLIKHFRECRLTAYQDSTGVWTIGWQHTNNVKRGDIWTQAKADAVLTEDLKEIEAYIYSYVEAPLSQNQFDALVSLAFNLGLKNFKSSHMMKKLNKGDYSDIQTEIRKWTRKEGKALPNLEKRQNIGALLLP